ncbi:acetyl-CoA carboxylase, carboxyltransferase subunit beta [Thermocrinis sp.]
MGLLDKFRKKEKENLWTKCPSCKSILYVPELKENLRVCPKCNYHFPMSSMERLESLLSDYSLMFENVLPSDPLNFKDSKSYKDRLEQAQKETNLTEALIVAKGKLGEKEVLLCVMDFNFIGGSMGSVVGERFYRACLLSSKENIPLITIVSSGGARMQEGIISLMQMAKTSVGVGLLKEKKVPYISLLTNPTMGGVSASFAFLGDIILAEPGSLIGFAGPRVIEQTIKQQLPEGFQTAEFLLEKGMIDMIVHRKELKDTLIKLIRIATSRRACSAV